MDIILPQVDLARAMKFAHRASDTKSPIPALACIHLRASKERLYVEGSDLYTTAGVYVDIEEPDEQGEALLPGLFADYSGMMPEGMVRLNVHGDAAPSVVMSSVAQKRRFSAQTIPAYDWPVDKMVASKAAPVAPDVTVPTRALLDALLATLPAANDDETSATNGMLVDLKGGRLEAVSTDGNRVQIHRQDLAGYSGNFRLVTSKRNIRLLRRMLEDNASNTDASLAIGEMTFRATLGNYVLMARTLPTFIPYQQAVDPLEWGTRLTFKRETFLAALDACSLECSLETVLEIHRGGALKVGAKVNNKITVVDEVTPEAATEMKWPKGTTSLSLGISPKYLRDALAALPEADEDFVLCFTSPVEPILVTRASTDFAGRPASAMHLAIVMPIKL